MRAATPLFNEKVLCGLGRSIASTGHLGEESVERALEALRRFRAIARILGVKNLRAIATAAVREAADGREFIARAEKAAGHQNRDPVRRAGSRACRPRHPHGFPERRRPRRRSRRRQPRDDRHLSRPLNDATTLPLGGLRLIDQTGDKIEKALPLVDETIARVNWLAKGSGRPFYAVGGTWRALAKLHMEHIDYPLRVMHGYSIPTREAIEFCQMVRTRQEALGAARHRGRGARAPRGAALRRAGARAAARGAGAL